MGVLSRVVRPSREAYVAAQERMPALAARAGRGQGLTTKSGPSGKASQRRWNELSLQDGRN